MILKRQNMSENKWNHFKIVPKGHNHCQLSIVNCQFGEAVKFQFVAFLNRQVAAELTFRSAKKTLRDWVYPLETAEKIW